MCLCVCVFVEELLFVLDMDIDMLYIDRRGIYSDGFITNKNLFFGRNWRNIAPDWKIREKIPHFLTFFDKINSVIYQVSTLSSKRK